MKTILLFLCWLVVPAYASATLKLLTFNVYAKPDPLNSLHTTERMQRLCEELKSGTWDVVLLQEVWTTANRELLRKCGYPFVMDLAQTHQSNREANLGSGLLILSRHPLLNQQRLILTRPSTNWASLTHGEALVWKSVYLAQVAAPGGHLWIANTHLTANYCKTADYAACDSYEKERYKQFGEAVRFLAKQTDGKRLVFGGDFNSGPHPIRADRTWREFTNYLSGFRQAPYRDVEACTSCSSNYFKSKDSGKLDHLFASGEVTPSEGRVVLDAKFPIEGNKEINVSDHYGWETVVNF